MRLYRNNMDVIGSIILSYREQYVYNGQYISRSPDLRRAHQALTDYYQNYSHVVTVRCYDLAVLDYTADYLIRAFLGLELVVFLAD